MTCRLSLPGKALLFALAVFVAAQAQEGARYLVVCQDDYYAAIKPLAEWRHATGLKCRVVRTSEIGRDTASVRNFIVNAYNNWEIPPEYVLIVAHPSYVRAKIHGSGSGMIYSDNYFVDVEGDYACELAIGRFPVQSVEQCELLVAKTLAYEKEPDLTDSIWMRRLTTIVREGYDSDDTIYWNNARHAATLAGGHGFVKCDSLSRSRGHYRIDVEDSVSRGTGIVMYRGTASGNWRDPFNLSIGRIANGPRLPVVLSITCATMALDPYDSMVGRAWVMAGWANGVRGAVAFFGNTRSAMQVARRRGAVARGFFNGLFGENMYRLGYAALRAKKQLYQEFPDDEGKKDYRGFNLFGDPGLPIWSGTPRPLTVEHPASILPESQTLDVTVRRDGQPVPGAVVCVSMGDMVYEVAHADGQGRVHMPVNPTDTGHMRLVVTGQNLYPYDDEIVVTRVGMSADAVRRGRRVRATLVSNHLYLGDAQQGVLLDASGRRVAELHPGDNDVTDLSPGVYFVRIRNHGRSVHRRVTKTD